MFGKTRELIRSILQAHPKILVFTSCSLVETLASEIQAAGIPAVTCLRIDEATLRRFAELDRGALVTSTTRSAGWRCDAQAIVFADVMDLPRGNDYVQTLARIDEIRPPYFINCEIPARSTGEISHIGPMTVAQLPAHLTFISDSSEVQDIREALALTPDEDYASFFVGSENGDYTEVWGMTGIVPDKNRVVSPISLARR